MPNALSKYLQQPQTTPIKEYSMTLLSSSKSIITVVPSLSSSELSSEDPVFISSPDDNNLYGSQFDSEHAQLSFASAIPFRHEDDAVYRVKMTHGQLMSTFQDDLATKLILMGGLSDGLKIKLNMSLMCLVPISYYCLPELACVIVVSRDMKKRYHVTRYYQVGDRWELSYDAQCVSADEAFAALITSLN
jgi:hypothetical protein